jgi:hypothetical protein
MSSYSSSSSETESESEQIHIIDFDEELDELGGTKLKFPQKIVVSDPCYYEGDRDYNKNISKLLKVKKGTWWEFEWDGLPYYRHVQEVGDDYDVNEEEYDTLTMLYFNEDSIGASFDLRNFVFKKSMMVDSGCMGILDYRTHDIISEYSNFGGDINNDLYTYEEDGKVVAIMLQVKGGMFGQM